jgi:hypothetical protein
METIIKIFSFYQDNISDKIVEYQKKVFDYFNINLIQEHNNDLNHPEYLDFKINNEDFDVIIFFDIDCIPLKHGLIEHIVNELSDNNSIIGVEQANQHNPNNIYAAPACFGITKNVFEKLEKPSFKYIKTHDVGGEFTIKSIEKNVNVKYFNIKKSLNKKWKCGEKIFGNGTIYDDWLYHQFELGRYHKHPDRKILEYQFIKKCKEVLK